MYYHWAYTLPPVVGAGVRPKQPGGKRGKARRPSRAVRARREGGKRSGAPLPLGSLVGRLRLVFAGDFDFRGLPRRLPLALRGALRLLGSGGRDRDVPDEKAVPERGIEDRAALRALPLRAMERNVAGDETGSYPRPGKLAARDRGAVRLFGNPPRVFRLAGNGEVDKVVFRRRPELPVRGARGRPAPGREGRRPAPALRREAREDRDGVRRRVREDRRPDERVNLFRRFRTGGSAPGETERVERVRDALLGLRDRLPLRAPERVGRGADLALGALDGRDGDDGDDRDVFGRNSTNRRLGGPPEGPFLPANVAGIGERGPFVPFSLTPLL